MFLATKYEEIYPLKLSVIYEKIAHKKLSIDQIKIKVIYQMNILSYKYGYLGKTSNRRA